MKHLSEYNLIEDDPLITTDRPLDMIVHALHEHHGLTFEVAALVFPVPSTIGLRGYSKISKMIVKLQDPSGFLFNFDRGIKLKTNLASLQRKLHVQPHIQPALHDIALLLERIGSPQGSIINKSDGKEILWAIEEMTGSNADWMTGTGMLTIVDEYNYAGQNPNLLPLFEGTHNEP